LPGLEKNVPPSTSEKKKNISSHKTKKRGYGREDSGKILGENTSKKRAGRRIDFLQDEGFLGGWGGGGGGGGIPCIWK